MVIYFLFCLNSPLPSEAAVFPTSLCCDVGHLYRVCEACSAGRSVQLHLTGIGCWKAQLVGICCPWWQQWWGLVCTEFNHRDVLVLVSWRVAGTCHRKSPAHFPPCRETAAQSCCLSPAVSFIPFRQLTKEAGRDTSQQTKTGRPLLLPNGRTCHQTEVRHSPQRGSSAARGSPAQGTASSGSPLAAGVNCRRVPSQTLR